MQEKKQSLRERLLQRNKARDVNYISRRESARISRENRRITDAIEKQRKRKNVPESEYLTRMRDPGN
ncbi:MAG: ABC transporter ATP-binding protein, partial [Clostridia bacterium]|nr:ABC transporter ATP-binding protein [Clostridia bacterium]